MVGGLSARVPSASALGLPGWLVVTQNRGKIRGRLRAVLARDPTRLATAVLSLDALHARAQAAFARFAWDWAWREAHAGFSFGGAALQAPTCELPESPCTAAPAGPLDPAAVTNAVLLLVARGVAEDLSRWVSGEPSALLSAKFYRYLAKVPDAVADPGTRGRSYLRLREHLEDTLADYFAAIAVVARRVVSIPVSVRGMVDALAGALAPEWDPALVPFPSSGSQAIRAALKDFLESELLSGGSGETP